MKRALGAGFVLAALVTAQGAAAADLSLAPLYKAPPATAAVPYDWSGFYLGVNGGGGWGPFNWGAPHHGLGVNGGGGWGRSNWSAPNTGFGVNGGQAGGTFGYNRQLGYFVFGLEGDVD